jgi:hypothetical protein
MPMRAVTSEEAQQAVQKQLGELQDRMIGNYAGEDGGFTTEEVRSVFQKAEARFADAKILAFLPILIERRMKTALANGAPLV